MVVVDVVAVVAVAVGAATGVLADGAAVLVAAVAVSAALSVEAGGTVVALLPSRKSVTYQPEPLS